MKYQSYFSREIYPQDIQCVLDPKNGKGGIFIGNLEASQNLSTLKKYGIKAVLTAAKNIILRHPKNDIPYHLHVPGEDHERFDLKRYFQKSNDFIQNSREQTNILVHCMAGISRSVTLVLAYLMKHCRMSFQEAFDSVKRKRKIINPNRGFIRQLQQFQRTLSTQSDTMRRSCDNFDGRSKMNLLMRSSLKDSNIRIPLHQSMKQQLSPSFSKQDLNFINWGTKSKYQTIGYGSQNKEYKDKKDINYQLQISKMIKIQNNRYPSFDNLNKDLDQKIANIRKKYMETSDVMNKHERNRTPKFNSKNYFKDIDKVQHIDSFYQSWNPSQLKKRSTLQQFVNSRITSPSNLYLSHYNQKKFYNFKHYNL